MGNNQSAIDPVHLRIYSNVVQIRDPIKRVQMINTCLASMEYVGSAKRAGIYSYLLNYIGTVNSGGAPPLLPGEQSILHNSSNQQQQYQQQQQQQQSSIPRALQPNFQHSGLSTYPSITQQQSQIITHSDNTPSWKVITDTPKQKAMTYFSSCLEVLNIQEEVALTEESLKASYKKMALRAHPDKGGSEEHFEAVTRAYAYLSEILKHMRGGKRESRMDAYAGPSVLNVNRDTEAEKWKHAEPVRLNAKNLDMNAFNKLFEQTHMPDPDSDGYGDWLKTEDSRKSGPAFKGQFNRDVFNRMFDSEAKKNQRQSNSLIVHPGEMALTLNPTSGVDLVGERPDSFTAAPNSKFQFTDLRGAYTTDSTISDKVSNVQVGERNLEQYRASREKAPDPFNQTELHSIREFESRQKQMDEMRERKRGEMSVRNQQYFDRMKQMVITDGVDQNQKKLTY
jgi:curved DNA-binding protein CbpA